MPEAVIVAAARSPIGRAHKGSLTQVRPDDMAASVVRAALGQVPGVGPGEVADLMLGCAQPAGESGYNMARVVAVLAGIREVPGTTVNRYCSSSLQTTRMAFHAIKAQEGDVFVSAGVETVSRYPQGCADFLPDTMNPLFDEAQVKTGQVASGLTTWSDEQSYGVLPDIYIAMGQTAENVAQLTGISRRDQDEFGVRSQNLAESAIAQGFYAREITPIALPDGTAIEVDDSPRHGVTYGAVSALEPSFRPSGTVTAGNSCPLSDGAAALVVMSATRAGELDVTPHARIVSTGVSAVDPEIMGLGPVEATRQALARAKMTIDDVDLVEINEAFAVQVIASARQLDVDMDRLNVNGGAIALGHPFGMTGARIIATLLNSLKYHDKHIGLAAMCVGGGQGMAIILERAS